MAQYLYWGYAGSSLVNPALEPVAAWALSERRTRHGSATVPSCSACRWSLPASPLMMAMDLGRPISRERDE